MNSGHDTNADRLHDLLADRATQYLSGDERAELKSLLAARPDVDEFELDSAAAAAGLSWIAPELEPMPDDLRSRVEVSAVAWLAERKGLHLSGGDVRRPPIMSGVWVPWLLAAACLALAVVGWWPDTAPAPAEERAALLGLAGTSTAAWQDNDAGVTGDVVWNNDRQAGYLRFRGLAANVPGDYQYQLWIFDESRSGYGDNIAVDGGVFDIDSATGEAVVPITAKLPIGKPALFAVTTEPPGGVVKHNAELDPQRYRIVLIAGL